MSATRSALLLAAAVAVTGCRNEYTWDQAIPTPPSENDHGQWLSAKAAPGGGIAFAYYDRTRTGLGFAVAKKLGDGLTWDSEEVDGYPNSDGLDPGARGEFCSMEIDPNGRVWVSYYNRSNGNLMAIHRPSGAGWNEPELVDPGSGLSPNTGLFTSLELDSDLNPVVAYHDEAAGTLKIAHYDGTAWTHEVIFEGEDGTDAEGQAVDADVGEFARLLIDGNTEYIAFYDRANGDLHLLEGFPGSYSHTVVATEGDVGQWPSMWTDGSVLHIAYQDVTNQDLVLATRQGGGSFSFQVIDDGKYRGADSEVFMKDDAVNVVYFDGHENNMMKATSGGSGWTLEQLAGDDGAVGFHNEVVQVNGEWWAASYDFTTRRIHAQTFQ